MSIRDLLLKYDADDSGVLGSLAKIGQAHKATDAEAKTLGQSISGVGAAFTKTLTPAAIATGAVMVKSFDEWHGGMAALRVGTGETGQALKDLGTDMKTVGAEVTQPLSDVGKVMAEIHARTGDTGGALDQLSTQVLHLAQITGTDAVGSVENLTRIFGDWHVSTDLQTTTLDKLFRTSQQTGVGIDTLSQQVVSFGPSMQALGFSFDQSIALLGQWSKEGVNVDSVLGSLKRSVGNLEAPSKAFVKEMSSFPGLTQSFKATPDVPGRFRLITDEILKLYSTGKQSDQMKAGELALQAFGKRGGSDLVNALASGRFSIGQLQSTIAHGKDTIESATRDTETWADKFDHLKNKVEGFLGPFGQVGGAIASGVAAIGPAIFGLGQVIPVVQRVGSAVWDAASSFAGSAASMVASAATTVGAWVAEAAGAIASAATVAASWVASWIAQAAAAIANAAVIAAAWLIAYGPIILIGALVVGLVVLIITHWTQVKNFLVAVWNEIKAVAAAVWNAILAVLRGIWDGIRIAVTTYFNIYKTIITTAWNVIRTVTSAVWNGIRAVLSAVWSGISAAARAVWSAISAYISFEWNLIKSIVSGAINFVLSVLSGGWSALKSAAQAAWDFVVGIFRSAWDTISGIVSDITNALSKLAFWRHSPSEMEVHAANTVAGVIASFRTLEPELAKTLSSLPSFVPIVNANVMSGASGGSLPPAGLTSLPQQIASAVRAALSDVTGAARTNQKMSIRIREREVFEAMDRPRRFATLARS